MALRAIANVPEAENPTHCLTLHRQVQASSDDVRRTILQPSEIVTSRPGPDRTTEPEADAVLLTRSGADPVAFSQFYRRHNRAVLAFLARRTGCSQTAADLCSETFLAAFKQRTKFDPERGGAEAWLFGIARNKLRRHHRSASRRLRFRGIRAPDLSEYELRRVEELADLRSVMPLIRDALAELPSSWGEAVRLRVLEERSYVDVAQRLGTTEGNARVRVSRGLARLAELMEDTR